MDLAAMIAKIVGGILLLITLRSVYRQLAPKKGHTGKSSPDKKLAEDKKPSMTEQALNNLLLYLWLAFMLVFSTGMILNN